MSNNGIVAESRRFCTTFFLVVMIFTAGLLQNSWGNILVFETIIRATAIATADGDGEDQPLVQDSQIQYYSFPPSPTGRSLQANAVAMSGGMSADAIGLATLFNIDYDSDLLLIAASGFAHANAQGETILGYSSAGGEAEVSLRFGVDKPYNYLYTTSTINSARVFGLFGQPIPCLGCPSLPSSPWPASGTLVPGVWYSFNGFASQGAFNIWLSLSALGPIGEYQQAPIPPSATPSSGEPGFVFENSTSGLWFDPPITTEYTYSMLSLGSLFTAILDFPTGFEDPFEVVVDGVSLGHYLPGEMADFSGFPGGGVSEFVVRGINPGVDVEDAAGFPLRLAFNTPTANFVMIPTGIVPEPSALLLASVGIVWLGAARTRRC